MKRRYLLMLVAAAAVATVCMHFVLSGTDRCTDDFLSSPAHCEMSLAPK
jgi:hypothetical protein